MKSLHEQITNRCIHFNGIQNKQCEAGVKYEDVRVDRPYKFPCLKTGGTCDKCEFPTADQVSSELSEMLSDSNKVLTAFANIRKAIELSGNLDGEVDCSCGGKIKYVSARSNGHIMAKCAGCDLSFGE